MERATVAVLTLLLAIPAGGQMQLCKHESGPLHVFTEEFCDGMRDHEDNHNDDHDHENHHSQHVPAGEHHEPCQHEVVSSDDEFASANSDINVVLPVSILALSDDDLVSMARCAETEASLTRALTRGPPVEECTLGYFALSIRLLI